MIELLKKLFAEIRPNLLYDITKWFVIAAASAIIAGLVFLYRYLRGYPRDLMLIVGIFAVAFVLMIAAYIMGRYGKRATKTKTIGPSPDATETRVCSDTWLHRIAEADKQALEYRVMITGCRIVTRQFQEPPAEIVFEFNLLNISVFSIRLEAGHPTLGNIVFANKAFLYPPSIVWSGQDFPHGNSGWFRLTQQLTEGESSRVRTANGQCAFEFNDVKVMIYGGAGFESELQPIHLKQPFLITLDGQVYPSRR